VTKLNRRAFLGSAAALAAAAAGPGARPESPNLSGDAASSPAPAPASNSFFDLLRIPDQVFAWPGEPAAKVQLNRSGESWSGSAVAVRTKVEDHLLRVFASCESAPLTRVHLRWQQRAAANLLILGDAWERSYGDLAWRGLVPERVLPWYFATHDGSSSPGATRSSSLGATHAYGVMTGAGSFCFWQVDEQGISLWLDVSNGGRGVLLGQRELEAATIVARQGHVGESPQAAISAFCRTLCPRPRLPKGPIYGTNDWYYAYGQNSAEGILRDTELVVSLAPKSGARPFSVIDAGWSGTGSASDVLENARPNPKFPDMPGLAEKIRQAGARPGIWIRPTQAPRSAPDSLLLPLARFGSPQSSTATDNEPVYDPTIPEALQAMLAKLTQVVDWKYELVKHDYSTYDLFGQWGSQMGAQLARPGWSFHDRSRTNAEIVLDLYRALRQAAGDNTLLLGCNVVGHLSAGLFEMQRTGDDTSGQHWERTRRMGVNTLAYRLPQHGTFFAMDADCVGITPSIPWEQNRQWLDLVARSGTALFLSPSPDAIGPEQKAAIAEAFAIAAAGNSTGQAIDWLESTTPGDWEFQSRQSGKTGKSVTHKSYNWCGPEGCDPYRV
jgi:alpha-galactosidase